MTTGAAAPTSTGIGTDAALAVSVRNAGAREPQLVLAFESTVELICIGRDHGNHIVLEGDAVSRQHAVIVRRRPMSRALLDPAVRRAGAALVAPSNPPYFIRDLSSRTGTWVDGIRVVQCDLDRTLTVQIGAHELDMAFVEPVIRPFSEGVSQAPSSQETFQLPLPIPTTLAPMANIADALNQSTTQLSTAAALFEWLYPQVCRQFGIQAATIALKGQGSDYVYRIGTASIVLPPGSLSIVESGGIVWSPSRERCAVPIIKKSGSRTRVIGVWTIERIGAGLEQADAEMIREFCAWALHLVATASAPTAQSPARAWPQRLVGFGTGFQNWFDSTIRPAAVSDTRLHVRGEIGVGKSSVAEEIHRQSARHSKPFVRVQSHVGGAGAEVAGIMELFGAGAEVGLANLPKSGKPSAFELANGGTLFIDEVSKLPRALQDRLLVPLSTSNGSKIEVAREADVVTYPVDVRIVTATNDNLSELANSGAFLPALRSRLVQETITIPALESRAADIVILVHHTLDDLSAKEGKPAMTLTHDALDKLRRARFDDNVRGLITCVSSAFKRNPRHAVLSADDFEIQSIASSAAVVEADDNLERMKRNHIARVLAESGWNRAEAARRMGVSVSVVYQWTEKYGLTPPAHPHVPDADR